MPRGWHADLQACVIASSSFVFVGLGALRRQLILAIKKLMS